MKTCVPSGEPCSPVVPSPPATFRVTSPFLPQPPVWGRRSVALGLQEQRGAVRRSWRHGQEQRYRPGGGPEGVAEEMLAMKWVKGHVQGLNQGPGISPLR